LPVYTALVRNGKRSMAYKWFKDNESFYHPIAVNNIKKILMATQDHPFPDKNEYLLIE